MLLYKGKVDNGIVAVTAYGVLEQKTLPLMFRVYKPKSRLQSGDIYHSKPEIADSLIDEHLAHEVVPSWLQGT